MNKTVTKKEAARFLSSNDNFLILTHINPDGDTLGSAFALWNALKSLGKNANVLTDGEVPARYAFLAEGYKNSDFEVKIIISVDIASQKMLSDNMICYQNKIDLCIDHHISNSIEADLVIVDGDAAANCEIMFDIISATGAEIDTKIAMCLYTGIATDTGCFKYSNTTARTHEIAGKLFGFGIDFAKINYDMFDLKSKSRVMAEMLFTKSIEFFCGGKVAVAKLTKDFVCQTGIDESEFDGLVSIPRQIEGVDIGITLKEKDDGFKISLRTSEKIDACSICSKFGGGGHIRASGCFIQGSLEEAEKQILSAAETALGKAGA